MQVTEVQTLSVETTADLLKYLFQEKSRCVATTLEGTTWKDPHRDGAEARQNFPTCTQNQTHP